MQERKSYQLLRRILSSAGTKHYTFEFDVIEEYSKIDKHVKFIQIGSNDGITRDPIHKIITTNCWEGILVEPVAYIFEKLKYNYDEYKDRLTFENSAIADRSGNLEFYRLKESELSNLPWFYDQLGSLKKEIVLKHRLLIPDFDDLFIKDVVKAITFNELLTKYFIEKVDMIHIDTEGYDFEIIKMIPFNKLQVKILMYEHKHLSNSDYKKSISVLNRFGFIVGPLVSSPLIKDTIAIRKNILNLILSNTV